MGRSKGDSVSLDPADAAATLLHRREARKGLLPFVTLTKPDFEVGRHHEMIAGALEQVALGDVRRLMIFARLAIPRANWLHEDSPHGIWV